MNCAVCGHAVYDEYEHGLWAHLLIWLFDHAYPDEDSYEHQTGWRFVYEAFRWVDKRFISPELY